MGEPMRGPGPARREQLPSGGEWCSIPVPRIGTHAKWSSCRKRWPSSTGSSGSSRSSRPSEKCLRLPQGQGGGQPRSRALPRCREPSGMRTGHATDECLGKRAMALSRHGSPSRNFSGLVAATMGREEQEEAATKRAAWPAMGSAMARRCSAPQRGLTGYTS